MIDDLAGVGKVIEAVKPFSGPVLSELGQYVADKPWQPLPPSDSFRSPPLTT